MLAVASHAAGHRIAEVRKRPPADAGGLDAGYAIQTTTDLAEWQTDITATRSVVGREGPMETLRFEAPAPEEDSKRFYRLLLQDLTAP